MEKNKPTKKQTQHLKLHRRTAIRKTKGSVSPTNTSSLRGNTLKKKTTQAFFKQAVF